MNKIIMWGGIAVLAGIGIGTISVAAAMISKIVVIGGLIGVCIGLNNNEKLSCKNND